MGKKPHKINKTKYNELNYKINTERINYELMTAK